MLPYWRIDLNRTRLFDLSDNAAGGNVQYTGANNTEEILPKFEECLQRLEVIVKDMEKGELPLEESLKLFEEGMGLTNVCRKELEEAEGKVELLLKQNGQLRAEAFAESSGN